MTNIRVCRQCGKEVDFDEPYCDHETMEESAILDMNRRTQQVYNMVVDNIVEQTARELGFKAGEDMAKLREKQLDN